MSYTLRCIIFRVETWWGGQRRVTIRTGTRAMAISELNLPRHCWYVAIELVSVLRYSMRRLVSHSAVSPNTTRSPIPWQTLD